MSSTLNLGVERLWWKHRAAKEQAVKDLFGLSIARYEQEVNALIDRPQALPFDPMLVNRRRRARGARQLQS